MNALLLKRVANHETQIPPPPGRCDQVPLEAFRLGKTRVFFRAGQISTLQKILNETPPEKGPAIYKRLEEALANRQKAKASAGEAKVGGRGGVGIFGGDLCTTSSGVVPVPWESMDIPYFRKFRGN